MAKETTLIAVLTDVYNEDYISKKYNTAIIGSNHNIKFLRHLHVLRRNTTIFWQKILKSISFCNHLVLTSLTSFQSPIYQHSSNSTLHKTRALGSFAYRFLLRNTCKKSRQEENG